MNIVLGRFQPFHKGHALLLNAALELGPTIIAIGSSEAEPSLNNPWSAEERKQMISSWLKGRDADIVLIDAPLGGTKVDAIASLKNGDPCAIGAVITAGVPRFVGRSNNTPPPIRETNVLRSNVMNMFQG